MRYARKQTDSWIGRFLNRNIKFVSILIACLLGVIGFSLKSTLEERMEVEVETQLEIAAAGLQAALERNISSVTHLSESFEALIEADPRFVEEEFEYLAAILLRDRPEVINVAIAPDLVVNRVFPEEPNQSVIGLDLAQFRGGEYVRRAIEEDITLIEGPVTTVQGPTALITRTPVRVTSSEPPELWGMVAVVVLSDAILEHALKMQELGYFDIVISRDDRELPFFGEAGLRDEEPIKFSLPVEGANWRVEVFPTQRLISEVSWDENALLIAFGLLCVPILGLLIFYARHTVIVDRLKSILTDSINAIDDGFVIYDSEDKFVLCNDAYRKIYEKSADLFVPGMPFQEIIRVGVQRGQYPEAIGREEEFIEQRLADHNMASNSTMQKLPDGTWLKVSERKTSDGARVGFRVDITELEEARAAAEEAFQVKSEFISVLSHELRTPLTVILGYAKVMANVGLLKSARQLETLMAEKKPNVEEIASALDQLLHQISGQARKMESSGTHLLTLINDLLDYSKIEQGHFKLNLEEFSLKSVVALVVEDMSDMAFRKGVSLEDETRDITLVADKIRFKQVMINLIGNAIKFTDVGCVVVETAFSEGEIEITVSDTGQGIPQHKLSAIFEAFQQADLSDRRAAGGTGLGLAISKTITEMHGGELNVRSELGRGSTFIVRLPLEAVEEAPRLRERMSRPLMSA